MDRSSGFALPHSELNRFLFAEIGIEASGLSLSVLSMIARSGLDPWREAARLAMLPRAAAIDGLAGMIAAMPGGTWSIPDASSIARLLVPLLPGNADASTATQRVTSLSPGARTNLRRAIVLALFIFVFANLTLRIIRAPGNAAKGRSAAAVSQTERHVLRQP